MDIQTQNPYIPNNTMTTELSYISEKFQDIEVLENFQPLLNKKGQAKLAFIEAVPGLVETADGEELPKLQFRFVCEGVHGARTITYTGWLKESLSEGSKLGQILKGFNLLEFETATAETVEEFDFEADFRQPDSGKVFKFEDLLTKLANLEGTVLLAKLDCEKGIWHRPDPTTFEFPTNKKGEFYTVDVSSFKQN
jgi:hypothetical protein